MKKLLSTLALFALLFLPVTLFGQNTICSGQIQDSLGNYYSGGSATFQFVPGASVTPETGANTTTQRAILDSTGSFSNVALGDLRLLGGGSFWNATVCTATNSCFSVPLSRNVVYGSTASLSAVLSASAPPATGTSAGYTFGPATGSGNMFTLTDTTSNTGTGAVLAALTGSSSAAIPFLSTAGGTTNGWFIDTSGNLDPVTVNTVNIGTALLPVKGIYLGAAATNHALLASATFSAARTITFPDPGAAANVAYDVVQYCGTLAACANTVEAKPITVFGSVAFPTASTVALSSLPFTSSTSFACTAHDVTDPTGSVSVSTYTSGAAVTLTLTGGTNTNVARFVCVGY